MQFRDLKTQYKVLKPQIDHAIEGVLNDAGFILGKSVTELENMLAEYVGRKYCIGVGNGTDALQLSLMAMDVGVGDAVFTSDFTYFASAASGAVLGATPVLVDIDKDTFNISPKALEKAIIKVIEEGKLTPKVIIPIDLFGQPADYDSILPIAEKYGLMVLEDAAQGFGGELNGKRACSFGDLSITSFFPAKPLGCYGDGGAIFTDDDEMNARLRSLRALGKSPDDKYDNREVGVNSRLDTLQAAILIPKFKAFVEYELEAVNKVADWYNKRLGPKIKTPYVMENAYSSWAQYTLLLDSTEQRDSLSKKLREKDIPSMVYYPRGLHQQEAFKKFNMSDKGYPNTIFATQRVLSLPMHPYLTEDDVEYITSVLLG